MKNINDDAKQAILESIDIAKIIVGTREFEIPINKEIADSLALCQPNPKDVSTQMNQFLRPYLNDKELPCQIEINGNEIQFPLPVYLYNSLELEPKNVIMSDLKKDEFGKIMRGFIPSSIRPPTDKQLWFAKKIAYTLDISLTTKEVKTVNECSNFIDRNIEAFRQNNTQLKEIGKEARLAGRGYIVLILMSRIESLEEIMGLLDMHNPVYIKKYLNGINSFVSVFDKLNTNIKELNFGFINEMLSTTYGHLEIPDIDEEILKKLDVSNIYKLNE